MDFRDVDFFPVRPYKPADKYDQKKNYKYDPAGCEHFLAQR